VSATRLCTKRSATFREQPIGPPPPPPRDSTILGVRASPPCPGRRRAIRIICLHAPQDRAVRIAPTACAHPRAFHTIAIISRPPGVRIWMPSFPPFSKLAGPRMAIRTLYDTETGGPRPLHVLPRRLEPR